MYKLRELSALGLGTASKPYVVGTVSMSFSVHHGLRVHMVVIGCESSRAHITISVHTGFCAPVQSDDCDPILKLSQHLRSDSN